MIVLKESLGVLGELLGQINAHCADSNAGQNRNDVAADAILAAAKQKRSGTFSLFGGKWGE